MANKTKSNSEGKSREVCLLCSLVVAFETNLLWRNKFFRFKHPCSFDRHLTRYLHFFGLAGDGVKTTYLFSRPSLTPDMQITKQSLSSYA